MNILNIENLKTHFFTEAGVVKAVDDISFSVMKGSTLGLVGESGSGKSVTTQSVLRIVPKPGKIVSGKILFEDEDLLMKTEKEMLKFRGRKISLIFQDPTTSLNPLFTIGDQLADIVIEHNKLKKSDALEHV
ncbi:unnamed protein product, partial [marine sediment metagenome]